jgi:hypothetical protein
MASIACLGLVWLCPLFSVFAQTPQPPSITVQPSDAELDEMLRARDWKDLEAALSQRVSMARGITWLRAKLDSGEGGLLIGLLYANDMWMVGNTLNVEDRSKDVRITAGVITLYTFELIVVDGAKCEDKTAPGHRIDQLIAARAATLAFLKKQPDEWKALIVNTAIAFEKRTAPLRKDDDLICRDGMAQMMAGLEKGSQHEVTTQAGHIGKTIEVAPPANWVPKFVSPDIYTPMQDKARLDMRATLLKLIE